MTQNEFDIIRALPLELKLTRTNLRIMQFISIIIGMILRYYLKKTISVSN